MCRRGDDEGQHTEEEERGEDAQHGREREQCRQSPHRLVRVPSASRPSLRGQTLRHVRHRQTVTEGPRQSVPQFGRLPSPPRATHVVDDLGDAPTCAVALAFPAGPQSELVEEFIGIVRGRKSSSSRGQAEPAPKRSAREKTMAKQAARAAAGKVASVPGKSKRGRR